MHLVVVDDSLSSNTDINSPSPSGFLVTIFRKHPSEFPLVQGIGDIVQFRHVRVQVYQSTLQAISTNWSAFTVFRKHNDNWLVLPQRPVLPEEWDAVKSIAEMSVGPSALPAHINPAAEPVMTQFKHPRLDIGDIKPHVFFSGVYKILHIYKPAADNQRTLLICDYTENELIDIDVSRYNLPEYMTKAALPLTVWDNFAAEVDQLKIESEDFVYFDNLTTKMTRNSDGTSTLTASLHGDPNVHAGKCVRLVQRHGTKSDRPEVQRIEAQRSRLVQLKEIGAAASQIADLAQQYLEPPKVVSPGKPKTEPAAEVSSSVVKVKGPKRRKTIIPHSKAIINDVPLPGAFGNTHVNVDGISITNILAVRSYPADVAKFCIKARVLAIFPGDVVNYVRFICGNCDASSELGKYAESGRVCCNCKSNIEHENDKFVWVFGIVIEDPTGDLPIIVAEEDAEHFLGCPAGDLTLPENGSLVNRFQKSLTDLIATAELPVDQPSRENLFCLKSYRVQNTATGLSCIRYRLCNTSLY